MQYMKCGLLFTHIIQKRTVCEHVHPPEPRSRSRHQKVCPASRWQRFSSASGSVHWHCHSCKHTLNTSMHWMQTLSIPAFIQQTIHVSKWHSTETRAQNRRCQAEPVAKCLLHPRPSKVNCRRHVKKTVWKQSIFKNKVCIWILCCKLDLLIAYSSYWKSNHRAWVHV